MRFKVNERGIMVERLAKNIGKNFFTKPPITILPTKPWCHLTSKVFSHNFTKVFLHNSYAMMNYVIDKAIERTPLDHQPKFFCRYVDDCFATFTNTSSIAVFLRNLNSVHSQIQFTKEV